jgi:hypothetical protein
MTWRTTFGRPFDEGIGGVKLNLAQAAAAATAVSGSEWMAFDLCIDPTDLATSTAAAAAAAAGHDSGSPGVIMVR